MSNTAACKTAVYGPDLVIDSSRVDTITRKRQPVLKLTG